MGREVGGGAYALYSKKKRQEAAKFRWDWYNNKWQYSETPQNNL